jgi:hypothetical protein
MWPTLVDHADNIILCYINYLRELRKYEAIPTYAKCLSNEDVIAKALGRLLFDITEPAEQNQMVSLINQSDLDLVSILTEQYIYALAEIDLAPGQGDDKVIDTFPFIEPAGDTWAGWRVAKLFNNPKMREMIQDNKVLFRHLKPEEQRLVRSLQWFFNIQAPWTAAFAALTIVLKQLLSKLSSGNFVVKGITNVDIRNRPIPCRISRDENRLCGEDVTAHYARISGRGDRRLSGFRRGARG